MPRLVLVVAATCCALLPHSALMQITVKKLTGKIIMSKGLQRNMRINVKTLTGKTITPLAM